MRSIHTVVGDRIEAEIDDQNHALPIRSAQTIDRRNDRQ